jgi:hypothetical protein
MDALQREEGAVAQVSLSMGNRNKRMELFAGGVVGDYRAGAAPQQKGTQPIAVVGYAGDAQARRRAYGDQHNCQWRLALVALGQFEAHRPSLLIRQHKDLADTSASPAAEQLRPHPSVPSPALSAAHRGSGQAEADQQAYRDS